MLRGINRQDIFEEPHEQGAVFTERFLLRLNANVVTAER